MTISQGAQDVALRHTQGAVGKPVHGYFDLQTRSKTLTNKAPQAEQVSTVVVDTATNDAVYTVTVNGIAATITADGSATKPEISAALKVALDADPLIRGQVSTVDDGVDTLTLTGLVGIVFTLTASALMTAAAVTAAATADAVPFGRLVVATGFQTDEANELGTLAKSTLFTAQVDSWLLVYDALVTIRCSITIEGETYTAAIVQAGASNIATEGALLRDAINAAMPANTVVATFATATLTLTAELAGLEFSSSISFEPPVGATVDTGAATKTSNAGIATSVNQAAARGGVSLWTSDEEVTTIGGTTAQYPANAGVSVFQKGAVWVESSETPSLGDPVYVELDGSGSDAGKFFTATSATRALLIGWGWERDARDTTAIAALAVPGPAL